MCYGCYLKTNSPDTNVDDYLDIRAQYTIVQANTKELLKMMVALERKITDRDQRVKWHAMRSKISKGSRIINETMNNPRWL